MLHGTLINQGRFILTRTTGALRANDWSRSQSDSDGLRFLTSIAVWGHWAARHGLTEV